MFGGGILINLKSREGEGEGRREEKGGKRGKGGKEEDLMGQPTSDILIIADLSTDQCIHSFPTFLPR